MLSLILQPFLVKCLYEDQKSLELIAFEAVAPRVRVQRNEGDGRLSAERAILPVEPEGFPSPQVECVPCLRLGARGRPLDSPLEPLFSRIGLYEFLDPFFVFWRLTAYLPPEGATEFFAASVTNSTRRFPTRPAHQ